MLYVRLGSYSHGSLRLQDVRRALLNVLATLEADNRGFDARRIRALARRDLNRAIDELNERLPECVYFGSLPEDPTDVGLWPDWDAVSFNGITVTTEAEVDRVDLEPGDVAIVTREFGYPIGAVRATEGGSHEWIWRAV